MLQTAFRPSCINRASVFEWHKRFKEGRESVRDDVKCGRSKKDGTPELIGQIKNFISKDHRVSIETISAQFDAKIGIKTVSHPPYSPDLAPCDFLLFLMLKEKLRGSRYDTIEEMKEAVTKVIDTLTQEDFHGALQKLFERYNKCIAAEGDYF